MSNDKIASALGLRTLEEIFGSEKETANTEVSIIQEETPIDVPVLPSFIAQQEVIADIEKAKVNIETLIKKGTDSLDEILIVAKSSQNPQAFQVAAVMLKTILDANKDFVSMSEKKKYAKEDSSDAVNTNVTNNNLILSTSDFLKMIKGET